MSKQDNVKPYRKEFRHQVATRAQQAADGRDRRGVLVLVGLSAALCQTGCSGRGAASGLPEHLRAHSDGPAAA